MIAQEIKFQLQFLFCVLKYLTFVHYRIRQDSNALFTKISIKFCFTNMIDLSVSGLYFDIFVVIQEPRFESRQHLSQVKRLDTQAAEREKEIIQVPYSLPSCTSLSLCLLISSLFLMFRQCCVHIIYVKKLHPSQNCDLLMVCMALNYNIDVLLHLLFCETDSGVSQ